MQRPAKPWTPVRFRLPPPKNGVNYFAAVAKQVDARDLKSLGNLYSRAGSIPARGTIFLFYDIFIFPQEVLHFVRQ